jgi:LacI family transcriptional regulator
MNGNATVDPDIAVRVREAARELDYTASPLARSLVLGRTQTVAFLAPDLANPTFQSIMRGLGHAAARDGYRLLVSDSVEDATEEVPLARELRQRCDGIVLCAPRMSDAELQQVTRDLAPVALINRDHHGGEAPIVATDHEAGIRPLAAHLYAFGHRRMLYLAGNPSTSDAQRQRGLARFVQDHPDVELRTVKSGVTIDAGHAAVEEVLASGATGVLAYNDLVALGLISGLQEAGASVPRDLSVTGFDDIPFARYVSPSLTTGSVPGRELGEHAWLRLNALLQGNVPDLDVTFRPRLEVRASTGPVPSARVDEHRSEHDR